LKFSNCCTWEIKLSRENLVPSTLKLKQSGRIVLKTRTKISVRQIKYQSGGEGTWYILSIIRGNFHGNGYPIETLLSVTIILARNPSVRTTRVGVTEMRDGTDPIDLTRSHIPESRFVVHKIGFRFPPCTSNKGGC